MIEEEEIVGIIQKKLEGNLTVTELSMLNEWLAAPPNVAIYAQYEQLWTGTSSIAYKKEDFTISSETAWQAIEKHIEVDKPARRFKIAHGVAAAVAFVLIFFGASYLFNSNSSAGNIQYVLDADKKDTLTFSDGSQAYLFGPCSISYPEQFANNERIISMTGFGYFDIAHDKTRAFEINTKNGKIEVLGTSFTVDTRQQESFTVKCITGKVKVTGSTNGTISEAILIKNNKATYSGQSEQLVVSLFETSDLGLTVPIRDLTFKNKPLREILERIEYTYGVTIQLEDKKLLETRYSTSLNDTTIDDFLTELKITFNVNVVQTKPSAYILKGGSSN